MEYGSIFGHGAHLGPDFTADYLHQAALAVEVQYGDTAVGEARTIADFKTNRWDPANDTLTFTAAQAVAFQGLVEYYGQFFSDPSMVRACFR